MSIYYNFFYLSDKFYYYFCFFFSSRRRHTRLQGDWSSHVCSSDLCLAPLSLRLGIEAGVATPALAERVAWAATQHPQRTVLDLLRRDHQISWSCTTLRKVDRKSVV